MAEPGPAGAVLVGGRSSRMGRPKVDVPLGGVPMGDRLVGILAAAGCARVAIVGDPSGSPRAGAEHVTDRQPGAGPLGGLLDALEWSPHEIVAVVACDVPLVTPASVRALCDALGTATGAAVAVAVTPERQPLCAAWRVGAVLPVATERFAAGERAVHRVLDRLDVVEVDVDPDELVNVNTPEDLAVAERLLALRKA